MKIRVCVNIVTFFYRDSVEVYRFNILSLSSVTIQYINTVEQIDYISAKGQFNILHTKLNAWKIN